MSARAPVGASNRSDLFSQRSTDARGSARNEAKDATADEYKHGGSDQQEEMNDDPLQLEHMLGYPGDYSRTVLSFPHDENMYIKSLGSLVSIEDLSDPHKQAFLRGHDMPVCALAVSESGGFIATGQVGTKHYKGNAAPIFLWDTLTRRRLAVLRGLTVRVTQIAFSHDEQFICGCDADGMLYMWELATAEVVYGQRLREAVTALKWTHQGKVGHHIDYELAVAIGHTVCQGLFKYDTFRMQWGMQWNQFQISMNGGLVREFTCVDVSKDGIFVYFGTHAGELMVFRRDTLVFRAVIPVCTNGVHDIVTLPDDSVIVGGGDGSFHKLVGRDMAWQMAQQIKLLSSVKSVCLSANKAELLVSCSNGQILRCLVDGLTHTTVSVSHTSSISSIAFPPAQPDQRGGGISYFATGTTTGGVRVWDLSDYSSISGIKFQRSGAVTCLVMVDNNTILSGWMDGHVMCTDVNGKLLWSIPTAHRDGTTAIAAHVDPTLQYFVTGGGDGAVRVWRYSNRELITQYTEHRKGVCRVIIDTKSPNIVHSVGGDCSVLSFDLKAARRVICHIINSGTMTAMTQRKDAELELITGDTMGRLLFWDIDIRDPVMAVQDPSRTAIRSCSVSPTGRFLVFAGDDHILKVMDMRSNQIVSLGYGHSSPILSLSWTPDEKQIISGGADSSLCIWNYYLGGV